MVRQQAPHLLQLGWANFPALNNQTLFHAPLFHAPILHPRPRRVQPKRNILLLASRPPNCHHYCQFIGKGR
jgi:hypothetical protein